MRCIHSADCGVTAARIQGCRKLRYRPRLMSEMRATAAKRRSSSSRRATMARTSSTLRRANDSRSEEHTSELQSLMRISYAVFCLKKKKHNKHLKLKHKTL